VSATLIAAVLSVAAAMSVVAAVLLTRNRARAEEEARARAERIVREAQFPVALGESVEVDGESRQLDRAWILLERSAAVAAIWHVPDGVLITFRSPDAGVYRAKSVDLRLPRNPPAVLDVEDEVHARYEQRTVKILPFGNADKAPWSRAVLVEYRNVDRQSCVALTDGENTLAWKMRLAARSNPPKAEADEATT
jgi:hypothetical protein